MVTDNATLENATSNPAHIVVTPVPDLPNNVLRYAPITIYNSQPSATTSPFQQAVYINSANYSAYENANLSNVEFLTSNGTVIDSWLEGPMNNESTNTLYWLSIPGGIPAYNSITVFMSFVSHNTVLFNGGTIGANPYVFSTQYPKYSYDNGEYIFPFYDNFNGNTLDSQWTAIDQSDYVTTNGYYVSNGLFQSGQYGTEVSLYSGRTFTYGNVVDFGGSIPSIYTVYSGGFYPCEFGYGTNAEGFYDSSNAFVSNVLTNGQAILIGEGETEYGGGDGCQSLTTGYSKAWLYDSDMPSNNIEMAPDSSSVLFGEYADQADPSNVVSYLGQGNPGYPYYYSPSANVAVSNSDETEILGIQMSQTSYSDDYPADGYLYWIRVRNAPPDGIMPSVIASPVNTVINASSYTGTALSGQPYVLFFSAPVPTDLLSMAIDDPLVTVNGIGSVSYTLCSGSSICPSAGYYTVNILDSNTMSSEVLPLMIYSEASVSLPSNEILDQGQQIYLNANIVNGTGVFDYQWYNVTSGNAVAMANQMGPVMLLNATGTGTFKYNVMVTDVGTANAVNSLSNNVIVTVYPYVSVNVTPSNEVFLPGSNTLVTFNAIVTGGTGNYLYQWYNLSSQFFGIPIANQISTNLPITFNSVGNYSYFLIVTDQGTTMDAYGISAPVNITAKQVHYPCGSDLPAVNVIECIPISAKNSQGTAFTSNTQIALSFPASSYETYEAANMMNIFVYNGLDGAAAPCWLEGNSLNEMQIGNLDSSGSLLYWCKIPDQVAADSTDNNWYFGIAPKTTDLYGNAIAQAGAAPQLYCGSPYDCPTTTYAGADNGNSVFEFYDNFSGTSLSSKWDIPTGFSGYSYSVNNGLTQRSTYGGGFSAGIYTASTYPLPLIVDSYSEGTNGNSYFGSGMNGGNENYNSQTTNYAFLWYNPYHGFDIYTANGEVQGSPGGGSESTLYVLSVSASSLSGLNFSYNYGTPVPYSVGFNTLSSSDDVATVVGSYPSTGDAVTQWIRSRTPPPNNIQPTITYGALSDPYVLINFSADPIMAGSSANIIAYCINSADTCTVQSPVGNDLCSGTGYCIYNTGPLSAGTYTYYANDITLNNNVEGTLTVLNTCNTEPAGLNVIICAPINIDNAQASAVSANTQIAIPFAASSYETYEASNMMNVFVYNSYNGNTAPCWLEGNTINEAQTQNLYTASNLLYWCKIPDSIAPYTTDGNWYIGIVSNTIDLYGNVIAQVGAAPQLYCGSPYNCPATSYAGADNGNEVFQFYDNFTGTSLDGKWGTPTGFSGYSYSVNNGLTQQSTYGGGFSAGIYTLSTYYLPFIVDSYSEGTNGNSYFGSGMNGGNENYNSQTTNYAFLWYNPYHGLDVYTANGEIQGSPGGGSEGTFYVLSVSASNALGLNFSYNYGTPVSYSLGSKPLSSYDDVATVVGSYPSTGDAVTQWIRARVFPPNGIMPTITYGTSGSGGFDDLVISRGGSSPYIGKNPPVSWKGNAVSGTSNTLETSGAHESEANTIQPSPPFNGT